MAMPVSATTHDEFYPLVGVGENTHKSLCQILFDWKDCARCDGLGCGDSSPACAWKRYSTLEQFFTFYRTATAWSSTQDLSSTRPALRTHEDLLKIIILIKSNPDRRRVELMQKHFRPYKDCMPDEIDRFAAFDLAARVLSMIECNSDCYFPTGIGPREGDVVWHNKSSFNSFVDSAFPRAHDNRLNSAIRSSRLASIAAQYLTQEHRISFQGVDELERHLQYDSATRILYVFRCVAFLKEHLCNQPELAGNSRGILPRQMIIETLASIHQVLFPPCVQSRLILSQLVNQGHFDRECLDDAYYNLLSDTEKDIRFEYWATRLGNVLHATESERRTRLVEEPRRNRRKRQRWLVIKLTIWGIVIATILSIVTLAINSYQAFSPKKSTVSDGVVSGWVEYGLRGVRRL